eukprot:SAG11_NODE_3181_length_2626_cov_2.488326_4_plen_100_part_00
MCFLILGRAESAINQDSADTMHAPGYVPTATHRWGESNLLELLAQRKSLSRCFFLFVFLRTSSVVRRGLACTSANTHRSSYYHHDSIRSETNAALPAIC